jgi:RNA polymerase sigma factor (sigma-70 family)
MTELDLLRTDPKFYSSLYHQHRVVVFQHLKQFTPDEAYIADLYQDAIIVLLERVRDPFFQLTCSVRTYLIAICRNQLFKRAGRQPEIVRIEGEATNYNDWLLYEIEMEQNKAQLDELDRVLEYFKTKFKQCYELLYRFFFLKESFALIAQVMKYTNADNAKNQKARCQKKLRELYLEKP